MIVAATALFTVVIAPPASAQFSSLLPAPATSLRPMDQSMLLTFSAPFALPKVTLPAGTYLFRFADPMNSPGVLQVMSKDGMTSFAMIETLPVVRTETESNKGEIVTFRETPVHQPKALDTWYFEAPGIAPGFDDVGCELIYK
jgi:hypothetical protein